MRQALLLTSSCACCRAVSAVPIRRQLNALDVALHKRALELLEKKRADHTTAGKLQTLPPVAVAKQHKPQRGVHGGLPQEL
jgi:hypothetical protein